jgi:hypothetical protein
MGIRLKTAKLRVFREMVSDGYMQSLKMGRRGQQ